MPRQPLVRALLALAGIAAAIGTAEASLRVRASALRRAAEVRNGWQASAACLQPDGALLYRGMPGRCGANSRGYLDAEHTLDKPPGVFRVVVIGDSVALGVGDLQARGHAFGQRLAERAAKECAGRAIEVIVLAVSGYASSQELVLLRDEGLRYSPDLILWSYCLNDPASPVFHGYNGELGVYYDRPNSYLLELAQRAAFFARERLRAIRRHCPEEQHRLLHCAYAGEVDGLFATLARIQSESGVPIVVLLQPLIEPAGSPESYGFADLHAWLAALAAAHGVASIDALAAYRGHAWSEIGNGINKNGWFDCYHPNHTAHEMLARYLLEELAHRGLLPCAGTSPSMVLDGPA